MFKIDLLELECNAAITCARKITQPTQLDQLRAIVNRATDAEEFSDATKVAESAVKAAKRLDQSERFSAFVDQKNAIKTRRAAWTKSQRAARDLKRDPNDKVACKLRGEYLCFYRNEWSDGLTLLNRMGNKDLSKLIQSEFEPKQSPDEKLAMADAWWDWANAKIDDRSNYLAAARYWYELAKPDLEGIHLRRVEDRLAGLTDIEFVRMQPKNRRDERRIGSVRVRARCDRMVRLRIADGVVAKQFAYSLVVG